MAGDSSSSGEPGLPEGATADIQIPQECNRDLVLGQVVQGLNNLTRTVNKLETTNKADHDRIFKRLKEGDEYFAVFRLSKCAFGWATRYAVLKWGITGSIFAGIGWVVAHLKL